MVYLLNHTLLHVISYSTPTKLILVTFWKMPQATFHTIFCEHFTWVTLLKQITKILIFTQSIITASHHTSHTFHTQHKDKETNYMYCILQQIFLPGINICPFCQSFQAPIIQHKKCCPSKIYLLITGIKEVPCILILPYWWTWLQINAAENFTQYPNNKFVKNNIGRNQFGAWRLRQKTHSFISDKFNIIRRCVGVHT